MFFTASPKIKNNKLKISAFFTILILLPVLPGCFLLESNQEESEKSKVHAGTSIISSVRLYLAKGSFSITEFEQFSLSGNSLFFECGKIRRGKNIPESQGVATIKEDSSSEVVLLGMEILGRAAVSDPLSLSEPGDLKGFTDSGKVVLNLLTKDNKSAQLSTGLNEVSDPATVLEGSILKLAQALRARVKETRGTESLCGNESFFGIK